MSDLTDFLRARLAEDEEAACQSAGFGGGINGYHWRLSGSHADGGGTYWSIVATAVAGRYEQVIEVVGSGMSGGGAHTEQVARHAVRHDPARVLREVEAKRELVRLAVQARTNADLPDPEHATGPYVPAVFVSGCASAWEHTLRLLAVPYADHPDYRPEWAPTT